ncbi:hypothetical protein S40288_10574 [Stachybotrys chartarum IBT 40288]|nr:hypothetical protein S40288_10574 [Stachybotrys chartarum IBT 40288]
MRNVLFALASAGLAASTTPAGFQPNAAADLTVNYGGATVSPGGRLTKDDRSYIGRHGDPDEHANRSHAGIRAGEQGPSQRRGSLLRPQPAARRAADAPIHAAAGRPHGHHAAGPERARAGGADAPGLQRGGHAGPGRAGGQGGGGQLLYRHQRRHEGGQRDQDPDANSCPGRAGADGVRGGGAGTAGGSFDADFEGERDRAEDGRGCGGGGGEHASHGLVGGGRGRVIMSSYNRQGGTCLPL